MLMEYIEFTYSIRSYIRFIIEQIFKTRFYRLNRIFFFFVSWYLSPFFTTKYLRNLKRFYGIPIQVPITFRTYGEKIRKSSTSRRRSSTDQEKFRFLFLVFPLINHLFFFFSVSKTQSFWTLSKIHTIDTPRNIRLNRRPLVNS